jgi:ferredoxin
VILTEAERCIGCGVCRLNLVALIREITRGGAPKRPKRSR